MASCLHTYSVPHLHRRYLSPAPSLSLRGLDSEELCWIRIRSGPRSPAGSGEFGSIPAWAGIHLQMPSNGARGQIPPRRGASAHRALCFQSRKYSVSTLGVKHFCEAQETGQTAGAPRLCLFISLALVSRGSAAGEARQSRGG